MNNKDIFLKFGTIVRRIWTFGTFEKFGKVEIFPINRKNFPIPQTNPPPPQKKCGVPILLLCKRRRQGFLAKIALSAKLCSKSKMFLDFTFRVRQAGVYSKEWNMYIFLAQFLRSNKLRWGGALKYWALTQFW